MATAAGRAPGPCARCARCTIRPGPRTAMSAIAGVRCRRSPAGSMRSSGRRRWRACPPTRATAIESSAFEEAMLAAPPPKRVEPPSEAWSEPAVEDAGSAPPDNAAASRAGQCHAGRETRRTPIRRPRRRRAGRRAPRPPNHRRRRDARVPTRADLAQARRNIPQRHPDRPAARRSRDRRRGAERRIYRTNRHAKKCRPRPAAGADFVPLGRVNARFRELPASPCQFGPCPISGARVSGPASRGCRQGSPQ